ncbi:MAG: FkbM family methyltransferase [Mesorhizobium sp.]
MINSYIYEINITALRTVTAQTRYGDMLVVANDTYIGRSLIEYGEWTQGEVELLEQLIQPGMTALDLGANVGYHTLALSKAVGEHGTVISFEPNPLIFQILTANIALNNLNNVIALNMAIGDRQGIVDVPYIDDFAPQNFGALCIPDFPKYVNEKTLCMPVALQRLDDIALARKTSIIKIDVEEMEFAALSGALTLIQNNRPAILFENSTRGENSERTLCLMNELNYECYWFMAKFYTNENYKKNPVNIFSNSYSISNIAIPRERLGSIRGLQKVKDIYDRPGKW